MDRNLAPKTLRRIRRLVDAVYTGRDELYAAADALSDESRSTVCRELADQLAGHAAELQQLLDLNGDCPVEPHDMYSVAERYFTLAKKRGGESGVLNAAENCERVVANRFESTLEEVELENDDTAALLQRQKEKVEFGEGVLHSMQAPPSSKPNPA